MATVQKKYPKEMFNSVPPEKLGEVMDAQMKEVDRVQEQVKTMWYPAGRSFNICQRNPNFGLPVGSSQDRMS